MRPRPPIGNLPLRELPDPERAKPCVMVVDDDESVVLAIAARLGSDFHVVGTLQPEDAVEMAARERASVILCDINMPTLKGDEVAYALSEDDRTADIPLIYLTALIEAQGAAELDGLFGDHPAISKSASTEELRAVIYAALRIAPDE